MKLGSIEFRLPWTRYVDMPIEAELYLAFRKSVLEDLLREVEDAANRLYERDVAVTEEKSTASVWPEDITCEGYCVKCKDKREFTGIVIISDSGRRTAQGYCPQCNSKMKRILGKEKQ